MNILPRPKLLGELICRRQGVPATVLCGGPSLPETWGRAGPPPRNALIFSANQHGAEFLRHMGHGMPAAYIVSCDNTHSVTGEPMEKLLRPYGGRIISPQFWADYRLHDWGFSGNSGMQAIYVAWLMGCSPIVVYGLDCFQDGTYWHDKDQANISLGRGEAFFRNKLRSLANIAGHEHIRIAGNGLAREFFPEYVPGERMPIVVPTNHQLKRVDPVTRTIRMRDTFCFNKAPLVPDDIVELTVNEAEPLLAKHKASIWKGPK